MAPGSDATALQAPDMDPAHFRAVLGRYPTGVCAITARGTDGGPVVMIVGTFTSVSLDPPLVGFLPARSSTTWPVLRALGRFCVNVLAQGQEGLARQIAMRGPDRLAGLAFTPSGNGAPRLAGVVASIDCDLMSVSQSGDHDFALCRVTALRAGAGTRALVFVGGTYGSASPAQ